jgi:hypothetical protein
MPRMNPLIGEYLGREESDGPTKGNIGQIRWQAPWTEITRRMAAITDESVREMQVGGNPDRGDAFDWKL